MGCCWPMYTVTCTYIHTMTWRILDHTTESTPKTRQYQIIQYTSMAITWPEPRSSGGNTSSNPHVLALVPPVFDGMERMCQRHGSNQNSHPPVLVGKPSCNQFIHYHISSRGVFGINHFRLRNFVIAIKYPATQITTQSCRQTLTPVQMPPHLAQVENRVIPCSILFSREGGSQREGCTDHDTGISPCANRMGKHAYQAQFDGKIY